MKYKIILTDNFGRDDGDVHFVNIPSLPHAAAKAIADIINEHCSSSTSPDFWQVVKEDYKLQRFEG